MVNERFSRPGPLIVLLGTGFLLLMLTGSLTDGSGARIGLRLSFGNDAAIQERPDGLQIVLPRGAATMTYTTNGDVPTPGSPTLMTEQEVGQVFRRWSLVPTSLQWRRPIDGHQPAWVIRVASFNDRGDPLEQVSRTVLPPNDHGLRVCSLILPPGAFFDPDTGIYVIGNRILDQDAEDVVQYPEDHRWWKYPGNYLGRGRDWERTAVLEMSDGEGAMLGSWNVGVRIHGNNTRGFAQHALRILFKDPVDVPLVQGDDRGGYAAVVLRAGGNDQGDAFIRDLLQHRACSGSSFETIQGVPVVLYVNGEFWGIHNLRHRLDDEELARRHHVEAKGFDIVEDRLISYRGSASAPRDLGRMVAWAGALDPSDPVSYEKLDRHIDMDGMAAYLASQLCLGNADWPAQNVRCYRWTGARDSLVPALDGRWRFMMGDSDQGLGYVNGPEHDDLADLLNDQAPFPRLFSYCLRMERFRAQVREHVLRMTEGSLSEGRLLALIDGLQEDLAPVMERHARRWHRPVSKAHWEQELQRLREHVRRRVPYMIEQARNDFPALRP